MESDSSKLPGSDGQGSCGTNIGVQAGGNVIGNVYNHFGAEMTENKKVPFSIHEYPPCSDFFCGREEVLRKVEDIIAKCEKEETYYRRIVAIIGLGGMGKSEIAKQLAKRLKPKYDFIFWFNAQIRTSLEPGFKQLAAILKIPLPSEDSLVSILPVVYRCLAENYRKAIFIFDNAEQLKAGQGIFGLEEYLVPDLQCKKPVFLITSRYPGGSVRQKINCIQLDPLSDADSYKCLLKYLDVEDNDDHPLPASLKKTIESLAQRLEGIPLLLSLVGWTAADRADKISLDTIESRVQSYNKLLEGQSLEEVSGESKYEERLQIILRSTVLNMATTSEGKIAAELLNIIALLSPDSIHAGLVNGIYCGKPFILHDEFCPRFVWEDLETSVSIGLKILMKNSLIKIERKKQRDFSGPTYEYDMIKVHRLIQKSTQNWLISVDESVAPIEKTIRYCEQYGYSLHHLLDHIRCLLNFCIQNDPSHSQTSRVLMLSIRVVFSSPEYPSMGDPEVFRKAEDSLLAKKFDPDSYNILCVLELISQGEPYVREAWSEVKRFILELSPGFTERRWVIELYFNAVDTFYREWGVQDGDNADLCDWFIQNYKEFQEDFPTSSDILLYLHQLDSSHDWSKDQEFISKVFASTGESERGTFWGKIYYMITNECTNKQKVQLLESLVNCSDAKIFSSSLQFSQDSFKIDFLKKWAYDFCDCIIEVARIPELRKSLLANKRFIDPFWDIMSFFLKPPADFLKGFKADLVILLIGTWCFLFHHDVAVYKCFGKKMDSEIPDWLHRHRQSLRGNKWMKFESASISSGFWIELIRAFRCADHCSESTRNWIQELVKIIQSRN